MLPSANYRLFQENNFLTVDKQLWLHALAFFVLTRSRFANWAPTLYLLVQWLCLSRDPFMWKLIVFWSVSTYTIFEEKNAKRCGFSEFSKTFNNFYYLLWFNIRLVEIIKIFNVTCSLKYYYYTNVSWVFPPIALNKYLYKYNACKYLCCFD